MAYLKSFIIFLCLGFDQDAYLNEDEDLKRLYEIAIKSKKSSKEKKRVGQNSKKKQRRKEIIEALKKNKAAIEEQLKRFVI